MTPGQFRDQLLKYALRWPFSETSGYRTKKHNAAVGGGLNSKHLTGMAEDIEFDNFEDREPCMREMRADHPDWDVVPEGDHVHVEWDPKR
jgi:uncharacterized protein YcbK (DUF882 family)